MASYSSQQLADLLYSFRAFDVLPTEIADQIQDVLEEELTQSIRSLVDDVFEMNCFKEPVDRTQVEQNVTKDITEFDNCLDKISDELGKLMTVPQHVLLPGDECFRSVELEAKTARIETRNQIKMKIASIRELRKEVSRLKLEKQINKRLAEAIEATAF